jgi:hypothetical protein
LNPRWLRLAAPVLLLASGIALAYSTGPPASETGSPAIGSAPAEGTCRGCHTTNALNVGGTVTILNAPAVYKPDSTYVLTVQLASTQTAGSTVRKWGFEITAVNGSTGAGFGTLTRTNADTLTTRIIAGSGSLSTRRYLQHVSAGTRTGQASPVTWTLRWTAPNAAASTVPAMFFVAGNAANGDFSNANDWIYTGSTSSLPPARVSAAASIDFGSVIVGATAEQTLQVGNSTLSPGDALAYSLTAPAGFTAPAGTFNVAAGASPNDHTLSMGTGTSGSPAGNLAIASNDPVTPTRNVALSGTVLDHCQPTLDSLAIALSDTLDFGAWGPGQFRDSTVRVFNLGFGATRARLSLAGGSITGGDGHFSIVGGFSPQLVGATPASVSVRFDQTGATFDSTYTADLTFTCADEALPGATSQPDLVVTLMALARPGLVGVEPGVAPSADRLLPVRPNPVMGRALLGFDLARRGPVALELYDLNGRRVRSIVHATLDPGRYTFEWNGADDRGVVLPAGLYLVRCSAPGLEASQRVALVR